MCVKNLVSSSILRDCEGRTFEVEYYLTENSESSRGGTSPYGISIEKGSEEYQAAGCFCSAENALLLLDKLADYQVTPAAAAEVMDSILDQCDFKY